MLNDAIFLSLPFDQKNHMSVLWKLDRQDPGYIFPISKNKSIIIINNNMINNLLTHNDSIHKMRFKLLDTSILINENSVMSPDGKKVNNMGMNETASNNEISKRNIDEWHYIYKHKKMIDFDYNITIIHTLFGIVSQRNFHKLSTNIFDNSKLLLDKSKINKLIKDINDLLKMEKLYTYKSKKVDVDYWTKNNLRRYINAVWTHLNEEVIQNLIYIKDKLESFQDTKTFKSY